MHRVELGFLFNQVKSGFIPAPANYLNPIYPQKPPTLLRWSLTHVVYQTGGCNAPTCSHHQHGQGVAPWECGSVSSGTSLCCPDTCQAHRDPRKVPGKNYHSGSGRNFSSHQWMCHQKPQESTMQIRPLKHLSYPRDIIMTLRTVQCKEISSRQFCIKICSALTPTRELKPQPRLCASREHSRGNAEKMQRDCSWKNDFCLFFKMFLEFNRSINKLSY